MQLVRGDGHWKRCDQEPSFLQTEYLCCNKNNASNRGVEMYFPKFQTEFLNFN